MKNGRYFLREQPEGTWIDDIEPWPKVVCDPTVVSQTMDQCMTGQQGDTISDWEEPVKQTLSGPPTAKHLWHLYEHTIVMAVTNMVTRQAKHWKD